MTLSKNASTDVTLKSVIARHKAGIIGAALCAVVSSACSLTPYIAVYATATVLFSPPSGDDPAEAVVQIAVWTAAALLLKAASGSLSTYLGHVAAYRALADLRLALAKKFQVIPLGRVQARSAGETKKILHDDVEQVEEALAHGVPEGAAAAAVPLATTAVLFAVDWQTALVALASLVLLICCAAAAMGLAQRNNRALAEHSTVLNRAVLGYLRGITVIRGYLRPDSGYDQARSAVAENTRLQIAATSGPLRWLASGLSVATGLTVALVLPFAGLRFTDGQIGLGTLILFLVLGLAYLNPVITLVATLAAIAYRFQLASGSISAVLAEEPLASTEEPAVPQTFDIRFESVGFGYTEDRPTVANIDLSIGDGESVALVGATGGGKSTLAKLLARFHDPDEGVIRIGGVDIRRIPPAELAGMVAFIQQDEYIFNATLLENIRIARPGATDEQVRIAAEHAQLAEVAEGLPQGWETMLSAGGGSLSGGQRQRVAIARALLKQARVIILDEATASLDSITEQRTLEAIELLSAGRTVISIAHRLSTIEDSDRIVFIDQGQITAVGPHGRLLRDHQPYQRLWEAYRSAAGWQLHAQLSASPQVQPADRPQPTGQAQRSTTLDDDADQHPSAGAPEAGIITPGVGSMPFFRQWRALYGLSWPVLLRKGLIRLIADGVIRSVPLAAIFITVLAATGQGPWDGLDSTVLWWASAAAAAAVVLRLLTSTWANSVVWRLAAESVEDLQNSVLDRLRRVPMGFFQRMDSGRTGTLVCNDLPLLDFQNTPQQVVASLVQPVYGAAILFVLDWRLALAGLAGLPLFWGLTVLSDRMYHRVFAEVHQARQQTTSALLEQARGAAVLRGNPGSFITARYESSIQRLAQASTAMAVKTTPTTALASAAVESGLVLIIAVGAALYTAGTVPATTLLLFLLLALVIYQPMQELGALSGYRRNQQQIAGKLAAVWEAETLEEPQQPARPDSTAVEFRDVDFSYREDGDQTLHGVSFTAEAGSVTALVGPSGAGKSTIAHLAARMWDPDTGSIRIGDQDLRELGSHQVMELVTTVEQQVYLFDETVRFNLALGRPEATDQQIWEALTAAQCDEVIAALPEGLDTVLNEGGTDLSGGQRQRLAIARALLKDSPVLILDEAAAAVDPATEDRIQQAVAELAASRTVLVIAHRLSTVQHTDQIVVVNDGTVEQAGTHSQLLDSSPTYRSLARSQGLISASVTP